MRLHRIDEVLRAAEVDGLCKLGLDVSDGCHHGGAVNQHVRLHEAKEPIDVFRASEVAVLEANVERHADGGDVGRDDVEATPRERADHVAADLAGSAGEQRGLFHGRSPSARPTWSASPRAVNPTV